MTRPLFLLEMVLISISANDVGLLWYQQMLERIMGNYQLKLPYILNNLLLRQGNFALIYEPIATIGPDPLQESIIGVHVYPLKC